MFYTKNFINQNDGVVAYIKSGIDVSASEPSKEDGNFLILNVNHNATTIVCTYRPPQFNKNPTQYLQALDDVLKNIHCSEIILTGDMNLDIMPNSLNTHGNSYLCITSFYGLVQGVNIPTRESTCIDHYMIKSKHIWQTFIFDSLTDHCPILLLLETAHTKSTATLQKNTNINLDCIIDQMHQLPWWDYHSIQDINDAVTWITKNLQNIISNNTITRLLPRRHVPLKPWITPGVVRILRKRDLMHKRQKSSPNNDQMRKQYSTYRNWCTKIVKTLKHDYYKNKLQLNLKNPKETWKTIKEVCNIQHNKTNSFELLSIKDSPKNSLNAVNSFFVSVGNTLANKILTKLNTTDNELAIKARSSSAHIQSMCFMPTDEIEMIKIITELKDSSSLGSDGLATKIIRKLKNTIALPLSHICNLSYESGIFPNSFKKALITPIFKSGDKKLPTNYRPISILPALSKVLEKSVNKRLYQYIEKNQLLADNQYGFRTNRSTEDAVLKLTSLITSFLDNGEKCIGVFLDLQKAFDTVSVPILLTRLENIGIRGNQWQWFNDYLNNRSQSVRLGTHISDDGTNIYGIPQGSSLSATLFIIYINELCKMQLDGAELIMFADDTAIIFHGDTWQNTHNITEIGIAKVTSWLEDNLLSLNISKTKYLCFSKTAALSPDSSFNIIIHTYPCNRHIAPTSPCSCTTLDRTTTIKYLGIHLDQHLRWDTQIKLISARVRKLIYIFKNLRQVAGIKLVLQVYKAMCESIITYCICCWGNAAKTKLIEAERAQRVVLKVALKLPYRYPTTQVYEKSKTLSIRKLFIYQCLRRYHKVTIPTLPITNQRHFSCPVPFRKSKFGQKHYSFVAPRVYNRLCRKVKNMRNYNNYRFKIMLKDLLNSYDYDGTEKLLQFVT